eukprot:GILK01005033.1.p1 GENE.GILK01005033.1~~GILK01005033.1.p1  ORF type:complete len:1026 (-),score=121.59 GILK01005033.1:209-3286(-)
MSTCIKMHFGMETQQADFALQLSHLIRCAPQLQLPYEVDQKHLHGIPGDELASTGLDVNQAFHFAQQAYNAGQYAQTIQLCHLLREHPNTTHRADAFLLLGASHYQLGAPDESIHWSLEAVKLRPHFVEAFYNLGNAYKMQGKFAEASNNYLMAIWLRPKFVSAHLNLASVLTKQKRYDEAIESYKLVVALSPDMVIAQFNLGSLLRAAGRLEECAHIWTLLADNLRALGHKDKALSYYRESARLLPTQHDSFLKMGSLLRELGRYEQAIESYRQSILLHPTDAVAYGQLGGVYDELDQTELAIGSYRMAIQLDPQYIDIYNCLGNALRKNGQIEDAVVVFQAALRINPEYPQLFNNLGNCYLDKGSKKEALYCYQMAITLCPTFAAAHCNLASLYKDEGRLVDALRHNQEAIYIDPLFADGYSNLGNLLKDQGRIDEAIRLYQIAISLNPNFSVSISNLGNAYKDSGRIPEAIVCYRKALSITPWFPDAFSNMVHSLIFICDWENREENFDQLTKYISHQLATGLTPSVQPFHALVYPLAPSDKLLIARKYAERAVQVARSTTNLQFVHGLPSPLSLSPTSRERVKIGYVSSDFGNHPLSHLMQNVFGFHNRNKFEVFCYSLSPNDGSPFRQKIGSEVEHFVDLSAEPLAADAARRINSDGISILINLNGYTKGSRNEIFALRPAPIQLSYMGFPGSMGADYIDYLVSDRIVTPDQYTQFYSESILWMPHSYFVNDYKQSARYALEDFSKRPKRSDYGLPEDKFIFGNFNQLYKIDPVTFDVWMRILHRAPNSVLWLLRFPPIGEANIRKEARARGISDDRIVFTDVAQKEIHINRCFLADLCLDTPLCNGHTTGCDVLWSGLPMITMPLIDMASRVAAGLSVALGCPEMIVSSYEEYEDRAVAYAQGHTGVGASISSTANPQGTDFETCCDDPSSCSCDLTETEDKVLASLPNHIRDRHGSLSLKVLRHKLESLRVTSPLFDTELWVRNFERGLQEAWALYVSGASPRHIDIATLPNSDSSYD